MKKVFLSGPYASDSHWEMLGNIRRAEETALGIWKAGAAVICPHRNSAWFGGIVSKEVFLTGYLAIMLTCDCVALLPGWKTSRGSVLERGFALDHGIPVFD